MRPPRKRKRPTPQQQRLPAQRNDAIHRFLKRVSNLRFFTLSLCLHSLFIIMVGGSVLYHVASAPADFEAGDGGIVTEDAANDQGPTEPAVTDRAEFQFTPPPPMMAVPLSVLTTSAPKPSAFTMTVLPKFPQQVISNSMRDKLASMGDRSGKPPPPGMGSSGAAMGSGAGTRSAMIFGKRIVASRLGVILDVSVSGHSRLGGAVTEIQKGFSDATLILYPGCGMMQFEGKPEFTFRKFASITPKEFAIVPKQFTTLDQLSDALKIETFKSMTALPSVKDTLFVAWYEGTAGVTMYEKLIGQTQFAFEELMKRGVDSIYWFSDFADPVDPRVVDRLSAELLSRRIVLHVHNFAGGPINPEITDLVNKMGGTVNLEKTF